MLVLAVAWSARAMDEFSLTIHDHRYQPTEIVVPAGVKLKLLVTNTDDTAEEFESSDLNREKVVAPGSQIQVIIGPLSSGRYEFFGDFHPDTARGHIIVP
jgi:heme/copper-type cytochrome/quinol oxidase subunit 2